MLACAFRRGIEGSLPAAGEKLVCLRNNKRKGLLNGALFEVATRGRGSPIVKLTVRPEESATAKPFKVSVRPECFTAKIEDVAWDQRKRYDEFDYGYVLTVHKAQGSRMGRCRAVRRMPRLRREPATLALYWHHPRCEAAHHRDVSGVARRDLLIGTLTSIARRITNPEAICARPAFLKEIEQYVARRRQGDDQAQHRGRGAALPLASRAFAKAAIAGDARRRAADEARHRGSRRGRLPVRHGDRARRRGADGGTQSRHPGARPDGAWRDGRDPPLPCQIWAGASSKARRSTLRASLARCAWAPSCGAASAALVYAASIDQLATKIGQIMISCAEVAKQTPFARHRHYRRRSGRRSSGAVQVVAVYSGDCRYISLFSVAPPDTLKA